MDLEDLVLRIPKGSPITPQEMDDNLDALRDAIQGLSALFGVALNADGSLKTPPLVYGASVTGTQAYVITPVPAVSSLASLTGRLVVLLPDTANTTSLATLEIIGVGSVSLGAQPLRKFKNVPLDNGDIKASQIVLLSWDGAAFQMQSWPGVVQPVNYALDAGVVNEPAVNFSIGGITSVPAALSAGYKVAVKIAVANTGPANLHIGALSAPIKKNVATPLSGGELQVGQIVEFIYDGTNFQMVSPTAGAFTALASQPIPASGNTLTFAHSLGSAPSMVRVVLVRTAVAPQVINGLSITQNSELDSEAIWTCERGAENEMFAPVCRVLGDTTAVQVNFWYPWGLVLISAQLGASSNGVTQLTPADYTVKVYVAP